MKQTILIFFGAPGSGKGTQAIRISKVLNVPMISTGDLLRREIEKDTPLGKEAEKFMEKGRLVPDVLLEKIVDKRMHCTDVKRGAILDGYPRKESQQKHLLKHLNKIIANGGEVFGVLIDVTDKAVKKRLTSRRVCLCGAVYNTVTKPPKVAGRCDIDKHKLIIRDDDTPAVVSDRLKLYHQLIKPLLDYWKQNDRLIVVNGEQGIEAVDTEMMSKLKERGLL